MFDAAQTLNDPAQLDAYIAGVVSSGVTKSAAMRALRKQADAQRLEIEREKERRHALFPELEQSAREAAARAAHELEAAARALRQANALFFTLKSMVACDELSLVEIGEELTSNYAERAQEYATTIAEGAR